VRKGLKLLVQRRLKFRAPACDSACAVKCSCKFCFTFESVEYRDYDLSLYGNEATLSGVHRHDTTDVSHNGLVSMARAGRHFDVELAPVEFPNSRGGRRSHPVSGEKTIVALKTWCEFVS
jgi:hypothetical protein